MILEDFTKTVIALKEAENEESVKKYNQLKELLAVQESELKKWARENGDVNNGIVDVKKVQKFRKWYDITEIKKDAKTYQTLQANQALFVEEKIDNVVVEKLAREGLVDRTILVKAFKEEELTPSIIIKI